MFFNQYPYINYNDLNLDFIIKIIKQLENEVKNFVSLNAVKYANPIQWNITTQYEKNTIVIDGQSGTAYLSVQPVPIGVSLSNTDYWTPVFDLSRLIVKAAKNFTDNYEAQTTTTATMSISAGEWLVWGEELYVANVNITAGDSYVIGSNISRITIEKVKNTIMQLIHDNYDAIIAMIGDLDDLETTAKNTLVAAINELHTNLNATIEDLKELHTIVNKINGNLAVSVKDFGAVGDGVTDDTQAFQNAVDSGYDVYVPLSSGEVYLITDTIAIHKSNIAIFSDVEERIYDDLQAFWGFTKKGVILFDVPDGSTKPLFTMFSTTNDVTRNYFYNLCFGTTALNRWNGGGTGYGGYGIYINNETEHNDTFIMGCTFAGFQNAIMSYGRGIKAIDCFCYHIGNFVNLYYSTNDDNFRGVVIRDNKFHHTICIAKVFTGVLNGAIISGNQSDTSCRNLIQLDNAGNAIGLKNCIISNNVLVYNGWTDFVPLDFGYNSGFIVRDSVITNNVFESLDPSNPTMFRGLRMDCKSENNVISNNVFNGIKQEAIIMGGSDYTNISNNIVHNSCYESTNGIIRILTSCNNSSIIGNTLHGTTAQTNAIQFQNNTVSGSHVLGNSTNSTNVCSSYIQGTKPNDIQAD